MPATDYRNSPRRHTCVAATLGIRHLALIINKMDLVDWSESVYDALAEEFVCFAGRLGFDDVVAVPVSALLGDNVVDPSDHMPWYAGPTLLEHLEQVPVGAEGETLGGRLPVQYVIRPRPGSGSDERRYAGTVAAGTLHPGDDVVVLPSGHRTTHHHHRHLGRPAGRRRIGQRDHRSPGRRPRRRAR